VDHAFDHLSSMNTADYLEALPEDQRKALLKLRKQIRAAAPKCEEHFGYGLPGFKLHGHPFIYMGAAKHHCALYGAIPQGFDEELKEYKRSKGAVRFTPDRPIPAAVLKAIVKAKVAELEGRWAAETTKDKRPRDHSAKRPSTIRKKGTRHH
jgi:uncharacterized protein YdhG (YjbR/CyaY superfamily)